MCLLLYTDVVIYGTLRRQEYSFGITKISILAINYGYIIIVGKTVVYGSSLDAYCCIQMLLSMGLSGDRNTPLVEQRFQFLVLNMVI